MRNIFIGIDPGAKGGIAIINDSHILTIKTTEMPLRKDKKIDTIKFYSFIFDYIEKFYSISKDILFNIEKAQAMSKQGSKQGVVSMFNYGVTYGKLISPIELICNENKKASFVEIPARIWKKYFNLSKEKDKSIKKCLELFTDLEEDLFYTKRGRMKDGAAEALLIAEYGRRKYYDGINNQEGS